MEHSQAMGSAGHADRSKPARLLSVMVCQYIHQLEKFVFIMHLLTPVLSNCPKVQASVIHAKLACWQVQRNKVGRPSLYIPQELFAFCSLTVPLWTRNCTLATYSLCTFLLAIQ